MEDEALQYEYCKASRPFVRFVESGTRNRDTPSIGVVIDSIVPNLLRTLGRGTGVKKLQQRKPGVQATIVVRKVSR